MEIFGGFMVMMSILGLFLAVIWFITPFVVFTIKGRLDRSLQLLEDLDRRMATLERNLAALSVQEAGVPTTDRDKPASPAADFQSILDN